MLRSALKFIAHFLTASPPKRVNDPFVKEFVEQVLRPWPGPVGEAIQTRLQEQRSSTSPLEIRDFGAGYGGKAKPMIRKTLGQVVKSSARGRKEGEVLRNLSGWKKPQQMLELGTNLGYSGLYLRSGSATGEFISVEGSETLQELAKENFAQFSLKADFITGKFDQVLEEEIAWTEFEPELVLLDGDHRYQATLDYVDFLLPKMAASSVLIMDDIYWSAGMEKAWKEIISREDVEVSVDLFSLGIIFKGVGNGKQRYKFRYFP